MGQALLKVENLWVSYDKREVLRGINFEVKEKEKIHSSGMFSDSFEQYLLKADNADTSAF